MLRFSAVRSLFVCPFAPSFHQRTDSSETKNSNRIWMLLNSLKLYTFINIKKSADRLRIVLSRSWDCLRTIMGCVYFVFFVFSVSRSGLSLSSSLSSLWNSTRSPHRKRIWFTSCLLKETEKKGKEKKRILFIISWSVSGVSQVFWTMSNSIRILSALLMMVVPLCSPSLSRLSGCGRRLLTYLS